MQAVASGEVDAMIGNPLVIASILQKKQISDIAITALTPYEIAFVLEVLPENKSWHGILDKVLSEIPPSIFHEMKNRYINIELQEIPDLRPWKWGIILIGLVGLLIIGIILYANRTLKREIRLKVRAQEELKQQEQLMIQQSRSAAMGEMISMIAHQWRQPLSVVGLQMNNLQADIELDLMEKDQIKVYIDGVNKQIKHMSHTIDDFKDFFKPEKEKEKTDLVELVKTASAMMRNSLESNGIELKIVDPYKPLPIEVFTRELLQVILNLMNNAKDALSESTRDEKQITISFEDDEEVVYLLVQDNGLGLDSADKEHAFEPYFTTKETLNGTGLGLYMAKNIIEQHMHGRIYFEEVDIGALIVIKLPK